MVQHLSAASLFGVTPPRLGNYGRHHVALSFVPKFTPTWCFQRPPNLTYMQQTKTETLARAAGHPGWTRLADDPDEYLLPGDVQQPDVAPRLQTVAEDASADGCDAGLFRGVLDGHNGAAGLGVPSGELHAPQPVIIGVCGETRITNKRQSWVTAIQVFEYYISHHLTKAFESVFSGVTCLPGCFSMYRLKARRLNDGDWDPILAQPEICREYSQSVVTTLHQKNLLLLGGGTTLMIRTFPARKMMFCPQAKCCTLVPDEFAVLVSQRRRWINSTIHNLMELVRGPNLCGTFCFSMQFFVFMELIGTIVLPIAITLTYSLVINSFLHPPKNFSDAIPLILGLPGVLILATSREVSYVFWMLIYLFVLPLYAFWHFGDFSWGETRKAQGEAKSQGPDSGSKTTFDANTIPHRRCDDWERLRLKKIKREERRRREFERTFGPQGFHLSTAGGGGGGGTWCQWCRRRTTGEA
ncbi:hypothetical protein PTTG_28452 [Puccinia triticina 1-1 BBBD Race 1]|uniref:chitin synthase n=1 Tax=Puccinia triticina (isolate 1-1 / race 1 (BBBD)) TaxID=630390 RepID=A0A180GBH5_PUCT1|nr:hypothetical protein PTTG_28452 [Puccinia triticina 1-1 BBBD Race 1]